MRTIDKIIDKVDTSRGAPMGRSNILPQSYSIVDICRKYLANPITKQSQRIYDCKVPMSKDGAYDKGGAYWGLGRELRVEYTRDLSYVKYYRA